MWTSSDFKEHYKKVSNAELLNILDNHKDYQTIALEAARLEFENRQLTEIEIEEARRPELEKKLQREKESKKINAVENKISTVSQNIFNIVNPVQAGIPSSEKIIRLLVIAFGIVFLYTFIGNFESYIFFLKDFPKSPFDSSLVLFPLVVLAAGTYTFWKRKRIGWTLLTIFVVNSAVGILWSLVYDYLFDYNEFSYLNNFSLRTPLRTYIVELVFLSGPLYILCKSTIREIFLIDKKRMIVTISTTLVLSILLIFAVMYRN